MRLVTTTTRAKSYGYPEFCYRADRNGYSFVRTVELGGRKYEGVDALIEGGEYGAVPACCNDIVGVCINLMGDISLLPDDAFDYPDETGGRIILNLAVAHFIYDCTKIEEENQGQDSVRSIFLRALFQEVICSLKLECNYPRVYEDVAEDHYLFFHRMNENNLEEAVLHALHVTMPAHIHAFYSAYQVIRSQIVFNSASP